MKQHIHMAAILERDGRLFLIRERPDSAWGLPGGPLPLDKDDIDDEMDAVLQRLGVMAPAIEEDFLQTHYFPVDDGQVVYNVYAATDWAGDPSPAPGVGAGWFALDELETIAMDERARNAVLQAFGMVEAEDDTAAILAALSPSPPDPLSQVWERGSVSGGIEAPSERSSERRVAGLDVLRTLTGRDPNAAAAAMEKSQPEIAGDVIDFALGEVWSGAALDRKTRSLQVVAMLAATGRTGGPLTSHINGALNHGASPAQVVETLRMVAVYAGFPAALEAWPVMERVFEQRGIPRPGRLS
ncbi:MAG: carboxymuconolactone decarboxylase family protein [Dehalococcoidia bacterium]